MRFLAFIGVVLALQASGQGVSHPGVATDSQPRSHALLIGCTKYDNLPVTSQLAGPSNDVVLLRRLLTGPPYRFPEEAIVTLSGTLGRPDGRPTRANIEREFRRLARAVGAGDQVVIALSCHGSQQPDQDPPDPGDPEPDGLDEILLPEDVGRWDGGSGTVSNAIVDDELRAWLNAIVARGASVCLIADACHSGTVVRGVVEEVTRKVAPEQLGIPGEAMRQAERRAEAAGARGLGEEIDPLNVSDGTPDLVAIYAALPSEPTIELPPPDDGDSKTYGLLTYTLCRELTRGGPSLTPGWSGGSTTNTRPGDGPTRHRWWRAPDATAGYWVQRPRRMGPPSGFAALEIAGRSMPVPCTGTPRRAYSPSIPLQGTPSLAGSSATCGFREEV